MAVYTDVPLAAASSLFDTLGIGRLTSLAPCAGGIENTNYFADTTDGRYVLTLFERLSADELPFYLELMQHLAQHGIPVPAPCPDATGALLHRLCGKPAVVVDRLPGVQRLAPSEHDAAQVGAMLARMHVAGADLPRRQPNLRGLPWWRQTVPTVLPHLAAPQRRLLDNELAAAERLAVDPAYAALPAGPIHADLFRDNVLFDGDRLGGFFDFYFAGVDCWVFDIAVCLNDWCTDLDTGAAAPARATAFVDGYASERPLTADEQRLLPAFLCTAALRFWLSRLWDWHLPRDASLLTPHDPGRFERVLRSRVGARDARDAPDAPDAHHARSSIATGSR